MQNAAVTPELQARLEAIFTTYLCIPKDLLSEICQRSPLAELTQAVYTNSDLLVDYECMAVCWLKNHPRIHLRTDLSPRLISNLAAVKAIVTKLQVEAATAA